MHSDFDNETGITEKYYWDHSTKKLTIEREQDIENNVASNRKQFNDRGRANYSDSNGLHKIASIPFITLEKWLREDGFNWYQSTDKERRQKLNHSENRHLLLRPGRL